MVLCWSTSPKVRSIDCSEAGTKGKKSNKLFRTVLRVEDILKREG